MSVSFDIKLEPRDLYRFNIYQNYHGANGWISVVLAALAFFMAGYTFGKAELIYIIIYVVVGLIFLLYIPVSLWPRAKSTLKKNEVLAGVLHYEVAESGIRVTQGEDEGELPWDSVYKMISTKNMVLIYSTRINAYIVPRSQLGEKYSDLREVATKCLEKYRVRMKK